MWLFFEAGQVEKKNFPCFICMRVLRFVILLRDGVLLAAIKLTCLSWFYLRRGHTDNGHGRAAILLLHATAGGGMEWSGMECSNDINEFQDHGRQGPRERFDVMWWSKGQTRRAKHKPEMDVDDDGGGGWKNWLPLAPAWAIDLAPTGGAGGGSGVLVRVEKSNQQSNVSETANHPWVGPGMEKYPVLGTHEPAARPNLEPCRCSQTAFPR
ncbi:hypothetical protein IWX50DRAFT_614942 [Phyllosticta citricarpa]